MIDAGEEQANRSNTVKIDLSPSWTSGAQIRLIVMNADSVFACVAAGRGTAM